MTAPEMIQFAADAQTQETTRQILGWIGFICVMVVCISVFWLLVEDFFDE